MKYIIPVIMMLILASFTLADGNIMPVKCDGSEATNQFAEGEEVCIYGVGFEGDAQVDIVLENETDTIDTSTETTNSRGVLSLRNIWGNIKEGIYNFFTDSNNNKKADEGEERQSLFVIGEPIPEDELPVEEVPEFGTMAAFFVLVAAGIFIYKKREAQQ